MLSSIEYRFSRKERWFRWYEEDAQTFALRCLQAIAYTCSRIHDKGKWSLLKKINKVLTWIDAKQWESKRIFQGKRHCLDIAVRESDSFLLMFLLQKFVFVLGISKSQRQVIIKDLIELAVQCKAYFVVHLLLVKYYSGPLNIDFRLFCKDVFILNYIMRNKACSKIIVDNYASYVADLKDKHLVALWLIASHVKNRSHDSKIKAVISNVLRKVQSESSAYALCSILLRMGFEANYVNQVKHVPPIFMAIQNGHKDLVRLLIYHCCELNILKSICDGELPIDAALRLGRFDIFKDSFAV